MTSGDLTIAPATHDEVDVVLAVLNEAAQWVVDRGAEGWRAGQWRRDRLLEAIDRGETFLADPRSGEVKETGFSCFPSISALPRPLGIPT
jgi:hypothetical protein